MTILVFFTPGFISIKVYDLLVPTGKRDFSSSDLFEAFGYSVLNYGLFVSMGYVFYISNLFENPVALGFYVVFALFIAPAIGGVLVKNLQNTTDSTAWDHVLKDDKGYWTIITLNNGKKIAGKFGKEKSFATTYPQKREIYLEKLYDVDENGKFGDPVEDSKGIIISEDNFKMIELFRKGEEDGKGQEKEGQEE
ncbi:hypothetical protein HBNXNv_0794 [Candidatus Nanohalovita haloferacivicina]|nr:hypothetical protein HBNXNv_0794 [Candidatus Nanohalobia archaeon BNXNv]